MLMLYLQMLDTPEEKVRFEEIYLKYRDAMFRAADGILHNDQDAEDAVHNAFLRIIKKFSRFQNIPAKDLAPQVVVIARNEAISLQRKKKDAAPLEDWDGFAETAESVSDYHTLVETFARLPLSYRAALEMKLAGYSDGEIASKLSDENGGQHPDQPGPPVPAEYRGAGRLFDGCVTTFRHGSEKVFSGFLLKSCENPLLRCVNIVRERIFCCLDRRNEWLGGTNIEYMGLLCNACDFPLCRDVFPIRPGDCRIKEYPGGSVHVPSREKR